MAIDNDADAFFGLHHQVLPYPSAVENMIAAKIEPGPFQDILAVKCHDETHMADL